MYFNENEYRNRVRGAWIGKTAGGTLGAPFEGQKAEEGLIPVTFYTQSDLKEHPVPNDDLDLQLIWLCAAERHGLRQLTPQILAEYWINHITGPWNEYAICRQNIRNGFTPPVSGLINNRKWGTSNGAWIRSEIWAVLFPGHPEQAVKYAWMDSCADHYGEGIYAEIFNCALESAAFAVQDIHRLIEIGLSFIPEESEVAKLVRLAVRSIAEGDSLLKAREKILKANTLGWFQAPANLAYMVLGLLTGEGDFGKTICNAAACGDDTDCTAAAAGAIFGILHGADALPERWTEVLGDRIVTCSFNSFGLSRPVPGTVTELTERVFRLAKEAWITDYRVAEIGPEATSVTQEECAGLSASGACEFCRFSSLRLVQALPFGELTAEYGTVPEISEGETLSLRLGIQNSLFGGSTGAVRFRWILPEGWSVSPGSAEVMVLPAWEAGSEFTLRAGPFSAPVEYLTVEVQAEGRNERYLRQIPVQQKGALRSYADPEFCRDHWKFFDLYRRK